MNTSADVSEILQALLAAQQAFPVIAKSKHVHVTAKSGRSYSFDYSPLEEILPAVMPALSAHGLLITSAVEPSEAGVLVVTRLWHISGQFLESVVPSGAFEDCKGMGSAISYARRFSHLALLNLAGQDDEDGSQATGDHIEPRTNAVSVPATNGHTPTPEPDEGLAHPTEAHISALATLALTECSEDLEVYSQRIRQTMGLKPAASVAPRLLTRTMSMTQYMEIFAYYRRLEAQLVKSRKDVSDGPQPGSTQAPTPTIPPATTAQESSAVPQPADEIETGRSSAPAPEDAPDDTVEALVADAITWGLKEDVTRRVIHLHKDLVKCRRILTDAAERNRRQVA